MSIDTDKIDTHIMVFADYNPPPSATLQRGTTRVLWYTHDQLNADFSKIEGIRPDMILNFSKPTDKLAEYQPIMAALHDAPIFDCYYEREG